MFREHPGLAVSRVAAFSLAFCVSAGWGSGLGVAAGVEGFTEPYREIVFADI